ncbi:MAG TPA: LuxR C-terminal-related transcriptional regulator [Solirubrobacteraceae bacterium]|nr:LuxR C-terminal-related transcriptional regulator [Solirubrobacteraceae bacterium]
MALADSTGSQQPDARELERILSELLALEREIVELAYVRRSDSLERARDAVRRLGDVGSPQGILSRAPEELGAASQFQRVLLSEVVDRSLRASAIWSRDDQAGSEQALAALSPFALEYPLIEDEVAARQGVQIVDVARSRGRAAPAFTAVLGWTSYVVAPLAVHGKTVGLLHADAGAGGRELDALDAEVAASFAEGLSGVFERAVLRETLRLHRQELQSAVQWMSGRLGQLTAEAADSAPGPTPGAGIAVSELLTPRELDVMRLLARGHTNVAIANALVVREGTIKYHVKNILRKLGATSRADAVSKYVRATGSRGSR